MTDRSCLGHHQGHSWLCFHGWILFSSLLEGVFNGWKNWKCLHLACSMQLLSFAPFFAPWMALFYFSYTLSICLGLDELAPEDSCLSNNFRDIPCACLDKTKLPTFKQLCLERVNLILSWRCYILEAANTKLSPTSSAPNCSFRCLLVLHVPPCCRWLPTAFHLPNKCIMAPFQWPDLIFYFKRNSPRVFGFDSSIWGNCRVGKYIFFIKHLKTFRKSCLNWLFLSFVILLSPLKPSGVAF